MASTIQRGPVIVRDCGVVVGAYTVRERTDGKWILSDERLPRDGTVAWIGKSKGAAVAEAERLVRLGSPVVIANTSAVRGRT